MPERKDKDKTVSRSTELAEPPPDPEQAECEVASLAAAVGWSLGTATRGFMDGVDRITGLLRTSTPPSRKPAGKKSPPEAIEPLLEQLGQRVSEGAKAKEGYASLTEDDAFWEVVERLHRQSLRRRRKPKAGPSPAAVEELGTKEKKAPSAPEAPEPTEPAEAQEAEAEAEAEGEFEDPLGGVLEEVEAEEAAADEGEGKGKGKGKGRGKDKDTD